MFGSKYSITGLFLVSLIAFQADGFNYDNTLNWLEEAPKCAGLRQSPISLEKSVSSPLAIYPITFHDFDIPLSQPLHVINNGNTVELEVPKTINGFSPFITGGGLDGVYEVANVHFHWGSPFTSGSEHAVGGKKYDLEMHIVCRNIKYESLEKAREEPYGLAVMAILFKQMDPTLVQRTGLNKLLDTVPSIRMPNSIQLINEPLKLGELMGRLNPRKFYTYRGSLTTPPCSQAVTWIVFEDILPIDTLALQEFWKLIDARGMPLVNNFRPLQNQNGRKIFSRWFFSKH